MKRRRARENLSKSSDSEVPVTTVTPVPPEVQRSRLQDKSQK